LATKLVIIGSAQDDFEKMISILKTKIKEIKNDRPLIETQDHVNYITVTTDVPANKNE